MKKSKRIAALIAAVLMAVTVFTSAVPTFAATPSPKNQLPPKKDAIYTITGYYSDVSTTQMSAKTISNLTATRVAATIVARTVDSKGNLVKAGGVPDKGTDNAKDSGIAYVTSGSGNRFTDVYVLYAALFYNSKQVFYDYTFI
ncbi:MAG: hypothetical protein K2I14_04190 [Eubacterium sp.]|nr:hypothetical protein [Eubacterium sp.]